MGKFNWSKHSGWVYEGTANGAAEEIDGLRAENNRLRADVERWVKEVAHLKLAAEKTERENETCCWLPDD